MDGNTKLSSSSSEEVFNGGVNCSYGFFGGSRRLIRPDVDDRSAQEAAQTPAAGDGGAACSCKICGKSFSSMKALYGHMRCHPAERKAAAVAPSTASSPPPAADRVPASSCSAAAAAPPPVLPPVGTWSKRAKRGRKRARAYNSSEAALGDHGDAGDYCSSMEAAEEAEEEEDYYSDRAVAAAATLMLLSRDATATAMVEYALHASDEEYLASTSTSGGGGSGGSSDFDGRGPRGDGSRSSTAIVEEEEDTVLEGSTPTTQEPSKITKKKTITPTVFSLGRNLPSNLSCILKQPDSSTAPRGAAESEHVTWCGLDGKAPQHRCSTCNRRFPSHQALGGHMASHRKAADGENCGAIDGDGGSGSAGTGSSPEQVVLLRGVLIRNPNAAPPAAAAVEHRCNMCGKVFPTGQALGGHKRKHWDGTKNQISRAAAAAAAAAASAMEKISTATAATDTAINAITTTGAAPSRSDGVKLVIDLNEPVSEEEDGGDHGE